MVGNLCIACLRGTFGVIVNIRPITENTNYQLYEVTLIMGRIISSVYLPVVLMMINAHKTL